MYRTIHDLPPEKIALAIEENLFAWIPVFGRLGRAYVNDPPGIIRSLTDIPISLFNSIKDTRLAPEQVDPAIEAILEDATTNHVPILWWIGPSTQPLDLPARLEQRGFKIDDHGPGMASDLDTLDDQLPGPAGLSIQSVCDEAARRLWSETMGLGFGEGSPPSEISINSWSRLLGLLPSETVRAYTGWLDGKPVATSLLFLAAGVAGIYAVATIPEARRKGIGAALVKQPLLEARAEGFHTGILQSSEMGLGVYRSLGFREYCTIDSYRWQP